jgi:CDP-diacylglycerol--serine O-phosphatidyltransferase
MMPLKALLPNIITAGNLACGVAAIYLALTGRPLPGCYLIFVGMVLDFFDGKVARLTHTASRFGTYLDSVTDILTFGAAPVILIYMSCPARLRLQAGLLLALYLACGVFRLVRFTRDTDVKKGETFLGMPIPAAAGLVIGYLLVYWQDAGAFSNIMATFLLLTVSGLMASRVPYFHFARLLELLSLPARALALGLIAVFILFGYLRPVFFVLFAFYGILGIQWPVRQVLFGKVLPDRNQA